tara:strand:+ start:491 stop:778 length:288 start_codon:yes stop_codon:yes gene_type:complete
MTQTQTTDARPHVMGNMMMVTGTFTNTGSEVATTINLSGLLADIVAGGANALSTTAGSGSGEDGVFTSINAATPSLVLNHVAGQDGTWWALGNRS